jgi:hypothetical protein
MKRLWLWLPRRLSIALVAIFSVIALLAVLVVADPLVFRPSLGRALLDQYQYLGVFHHLSGPLPI